MAIFVRRTAAAPALLALLLGVLLLAHRAQGASCTVPVDAGCGSVQAALDQATAGDTISVNTGVYSEKVSFPAGGSAGNPITLQATPGHAPVLDGTSVPGHNMILIDGRTAPKSYIVVRGFEIRNNLNLKPPNDGSGIRILGSGTGIEIRDNEIHNITGQHAMGVTVYGTESTSISNLIIDGNTIHDCEPAQSEALALNGNVENFQVTNNTVRDVNNIGIVCIGGETDVQPDPALVCRDGLIKGNHVIRANSSYGGGYAGGIYVDGGKNVTIENNVVEAGDIGIAVGAENAGQVAEGVRVRNNVVFANEKAGIYCGGYEASVGRANGNEFRGNTLYKNNTVGEDGQGTYFSGGGFGEIWLEYAEGNVVEGNLVYAGDENVFVAAGIPGSGSGNSFDYNLYFSEAGVASGEFQQNGTSYSGLAAWQSGASQDANAVTGDPLFRDAAGGDFHIDVSSPAVGAGNPSYVTTPSPFGPETDLDGLDRVVGAAVDAGADEGTCGNGSPEGGEACDDGNAIDCDGCNNDCTLSGTCGNGVTCPGYGEECDDGNSSDGDCCSSSCSFESPGSPCSDQNACTASDQCDGSGTCTADPVGGPGCALEKSLLACQEAVARAGRIYLETRLRSLQRCRDQLNRGKTLHADKAGAVVIAGPGDCEQEYRAALRIGKSGQKARATIAKPAKPKCTDAQLAALSTCSASVDGLIDADGDGGCLIATAAAAVDAMLDDEYGTPLTGAESEYGALRRCQERLARAGESYAKRSVKRLQQCRDALHRGRELFFDQDKVLPLTDPEDCAAEYKTAAKIRKAGERVRAAVAGQCSDPLLATLADACATTVDGLVDASGAAGCLITGHDAQISTVLDAQY